VLGHICPLGLLGCFFVWADFPSALKILYDFCMTFDGFKDRNAKDGKGTKAHGFKNNGSDKTIENTG
jgi:hypothetical protein